MLISEWADEFAYLPVEGNAEPGKYRSNRAPYQRDMLNDPLDPRISESYWQIASQLGKTACIIFIVEYFIDQQPAAILVVYPTLDSGKAWVREKLEPTVNSTPKLKGRLKDPKSRNSENTTLNKKFPGGNITVAGANSPSGLRQRSKRVVILDEIDAYRPNSEGDPIKQADKRADSFHNPVKLKSSTPTRPGSKIKSGFDLSDRQYFFCPCPLCTHWQTFKMEQFKWPEGRPEDAVLVCENPNCKTELTDQQRIWMIHRGQWRATAPFKGKRGRHLNGFYRLFGKKPAFKSHLHEFAQAYLDAVEAGPEEVEVWTNTFLAEVYEPPGETIEWKDLMSRCEDYGAEVPEDCLMLTGSADVQGDRIESHVWGFGLGEEAWHIKKAVFLGNPLLPKVWTELDAFLAQQFEDKHKNRFRIIRTFIDMRHKPKEVCAFVRRRAPLIYACYGADTLQHQVAVKKKRNSYGAVPFCIGVETVKDILFSRLKLADMGPRYIHFRDGTPQEFFEQLTAEKKVTKLRFGFPESHYEKIRPRNEDLDLTVYAFAAMDTLKPNLEVLAKNLASQRKKVVLESGIDKSNESNTPEPQAPSKVQPPKRPPSPPRRSFVAGWKKF